MSKKTIDYIQSIEDEDIFFDLFIISYIGILGLYQINQSNNLLRLQLKKYRQVLNAISIDNIDIYYMIDKLYKSKRMTLHYGIDLISYFQMFRDPNFTLSLKEHEIKETLKKLPNAVYRRCNGQIKFIYKAYVNDVLSLTQTVNKFYSYCKREGIDTIDFMRFARVMKRKETVEIESPIEESLNKNATDLLKFVYDNIDILSKTLPDKYIKYCTERIKKLYGDSTNMDYKDIDFLVDMKKFIKKGM